MFKRIKAVFAKKRVNQSEFYEDSPIDFLHDRITQLDQELTKTKKNLAFAQERARNFAFEIERLDRLKTKYAKTLKATEG